MNIARLLDIAGVPPELRQGAVECLDHAKVRAKGLLWHKAKVRLLRAGRIARAMPWEAERLLDVRPEWARWDVAPMRNITGHGDNVPWDESGPVTGAWLAEDDEAIAACYWARGHHPRSETARRAWYRRNGGEYEAWLRGLPVDADLPVQEWAGEQGRTRVEVVRCGAVWIINSYRRCGPIVLKGRHGFEIDNIFQRINGQRVQAWYPIPGYALRAPVTWSITFARAGRV